MRKCFCVVLMTVMCFVLGFSEKVNFVKMEGYPTQPGYYLMQNSFGSFVSFYPNTACSSGIGLGRLTDSDYGFVKKGQDTISYNYNVESDRAYTLAARLITKFSLSSDKETLQEGCGVHVCWQYESSTTWVHTEGNSFFYPMQYAVYYKDSLSSVPLLKRYIYPLRDSLNNVVLDSLGNPMEMFDNQYVLQLYSYSDSSWTSTGVSAGGYSFKSNYDHGGTLRIKYPDAQCESFLDTVVRLDSFMSKMIWDRSGALSDAYYNFGKITYWRMEEDLTSCLFFKAVSANSSIMLINERNNPNVQYSLDNGKTWETLPGKQKIVLRNVGDRVLVRGLNPDGFSRSESEYSHFSMEGSVYVGGNVMSLIDKFGQSRTIPNSYCFVNLFDGCSAMTHSPVLPAKELKEGCYKNMFRSCKKLQVAPSLPSSEMAASCYEAMFLKCEALTETPKLIANVLADACYKNMFNGCTRINTAPALPADKMENSCYEGMFAFTGLTKAPELKSTSLAPSCYKSMFFQCYSMKTAPQLPATKMEESCYESMFGLSGITTMPELKSMVLAKSCYESMFLLCRSLSKIGSLPATELAESCYASMFEGAGSFTDLSTMVLPATKLAKSCYKGMFLECTRLEKAPVLPATELAESCYASMFSYCSSLRYVEVGFSEWMEGSTYNWLSGVSGSGTFVSPDELPVILGASNIPVGWRELTSVSDVEDEQCFIWQSDGIIFVKSKCEEVSVFDRLGRRIPTISNNSINYFSPLKNDIYIIKVGSRTRKVLAQ